jgi:hypothetical protein
MIATSLEEKRAASPAAPTGDGDPRVSQKKHRPTVKLTQAMAEAYAPTKHTVLSLAISQRKFDLLKHPMLRMLIEHKWAAFARERFAWYYAFMCFHIVCVSVAVWTRPMSPDLGELHEIDSGTSVTRTVAEALVCVNAAYILAGEAGEIVDQGWGYFFDLNTVENVLQIAHILAVLVQLVFKVLLLAGAEDGEGRDGHLHRGEVVLSSLVCCTVWMMFLYLNRTVKSFGPLVIVVERVALEEMSKFILLLLAIVVGFSQAFYVVYACAEADDESAYGAGVVGGLFESFLQSLGSPQEEFNFDATPVPAWAKALFVVYVIITSLLLLNIIVAIFTTAFEFVMEHSEDIWYHARAELILSYEASPSCLRKWEAYCLSTSCFQNREVDAQVEGKERGKAGSTLAKTDLVIQQYTEMDKVGES